MDGLSGDSMKVVLPEHRQMVTDMLGQMSTEMSDMNMTMGVGWKALGDSLRQDLTRMPDLGAPELPAFMREHGQRAMRFMETQRGMTGSMRM